MSTNIHSQNPYFRIEVPVNSENEKHLRMMCADGRLSCDCLLVRHERAILVAHQQDIELLQKMGFQVYKIANVVDQSYLVRKERAKSKTSTDASGLLSGFVTQYLDTQGIMDRFTAYHMKFPLLTQWIDLPFSTTGYDGSVVSLRGLKTVKLFRITTTPTSIAKPGILLIAGTHAREWVPPLAAIEFVGQLLNNYVPGSPNPVIQSINRIVEGLDVFVVPVLNPDGFNYSFHDEPMWRKNRHHFTPPVSNTCVGVDLNRNYSVYWGGVGASNQPCNDSYRGMNDLSEPENRNIDYILGHYPNILTAIDCHSFGESIYRPQPTGGAYIAAEPVAPEDNAIYLTLENMMNAAIASVSPNKHYATGTTNNHAGTSDEYLFFAHRIFAFDLECAEDFQPPIAQALIAAQEVAAATRALATQTLTLANQFFYPTTLTQLIDQSGSMVAYGYSEPTRFNAKRLIDLMSLNDQVAVCSFNETASIELATTVISNTSVFAKARSAVETIAFGGWTSIGAGLTAAATQLAHVAGPKAIILLSDGYQNRQPWVADTLPLLPTETSIYTIALGPQSDQHLLQTMASSTGGAYYFSPSALDLHEIYNFARAAANDEELALNETITLNKNIKNSVVRQIVVDDGAMNLTIAVSWNETPADFQITLVPPAGSMMALNRVNTVSGDGYRIFRLRRPAAGVWSINLNPSGNPVAVNVAAFLRSDLRLRLTPYDYSFKEKDPLHLLVQVVDGEHAVTSYAGTSSVARPETNLKRLTDNWYQKKGQLPTIAPANLKSEDAIPQSVVQALTVRNNLLRETGHDPLQYCIDTIPITMPSVSQLNEIKSKLSEFKRHEMGYRTLTKKALELGQSLDCVRHIVFHNALVSGTYNVKVIVQGSSNISGRSFVRVGLHSIYVT